MESGLVGPRKGRNLGERKHLKGVHKKERHLKKRIRKGEEGIQKTSRRTVNRNAHPYKEKVNGKEVKTKGRCVKLWVG